MVMTLITHIPRPDRLIMGIEWLISFVQPSEWAKHSQQQHSLRPRRSRRERAVGDVFRA